jgi:hypothetical protein
MVCRLEQLDLAYVLQAAVQENLLRRDVARVGIGADRFQAESSERVVDYGCGRFAGLPVAPIGLAHPIAERRLFATVTRGSVETHAAD